MSLGKFDGISISSIGKLTKAICFGGYSSTYTEDNEIWS